MSTTLLLNATWEPLRVLPLRRALGLVLAEKAVVLHEDEAAEIRSASMSMKVPRVIRLLYVVKVPYRARLPLSRRAVIARDHGCCAYCGGKATTIDHVVPRSRGGTHRWENVVAACGPCNAAKDDKLLAELGWRLERKPVAPKGTVWVVFGLAELDPSWEPYLGQSLAPA